MRKTFLVFTLLILFSSLGFLSNFVFADALEAPTIIYPSSGDSPILAGQIEFKWQSTDADYYKYHINLPNGQAQEEVINRTSKKIYDLAAKENYTWAVCSCEDLEGENCSDWSELQSFQIVWASYEISKGLVPCGRKYDSAETPKINESKPCEFADIFVMLKLILNFMLWRISMIVLVLLAIASAIISYFSMGDASTIARIKSIWQYCGTGFIIMLLAWLVIDLLLALLGYDVSFFGKWWSL